MSYDDTSARPPLTVVTVNGKQFVSGLKWKTLENYRTYMNEARDYGKKEGMDMVAIRRGTVMQAGFAPKSQQRLRGMYSLAAALAGPLGDNWIGVFALPGDQFAFIAVNEGSVMVASDIVGDRNHIEAEFNEAFGVLQNENNDQWSGQVIAPPDWQFAQSHSTLEDLLDPKALRSENRLRPLTFGLTRREILITAAALAVLSGIGIGFLKWQSLNQQRKNAAAAAVVLELQKAQEAQALAEAAEARKKLVRPWEQFPAAATLAAACDAVWRDTPLSLGGWIFTGGQCGPGKAVATFKRSDSGTTVKQFADAVRAAFAQQPAIYEAGTTGTVLASFALSPGGAEELPATAAQMETFTAQLQALGAGTTFTLEEVPWKAPEDQPDAIAPDWVTHSFTVTTPVSPSSLLADLDGNGLRVMEIAVSLNPEDAQLNWAITGEIYGR
jgi:hypothetical protein